MSILIDGKVIDDSRLSEIKRILLGNKTSPELVAQAYGLTMEQLQKVREML